MALTISLNSKTSTSATIDLAGRTTGTYDKIQFQYCVRSDFNFALAPIPEYATAASIVLQSLNQGNTYFIRAREKKSSDGTVGPWTAALQVYLVIGVAQDPSPLSILVRPAIIVVPEPVTWGGFGYDLGHPPDNLGTDAVNEVFWMTGSNWLSFDTGGQPIDTIALLGTNVPASGDWNILGYPTKAGRDALDGTFSFSQALTSFQASPGLPGRSSYHGLARLTSIRSERFWALGVSAAANAPANLTAITFGVVGLARTAKNIAADKVETPVDYGSLERTRDGIPDRRYGWRGRRVDFEIAFMTEAQWETQFSDLRNKVGLTDPVLVVPNTRAGAFLHDRILYGPLNAQRAQQPYSPRFTQGFTIDSLI